MKSAPLPVAIAACTGHTSDVALAACFYELPTERAELAPDLIPIQLTPSGVFVPRDGRPMTVPGWKIDFEIAERVISAFRAEATPPVVDYEHQTLNAERNGLPAPAAGFIESLEWRDGSGLWALVKFTARAKQFITDGEYRYVSPVFLYDEDGAVTKLLMAAITNYPAIDGMDAMKLQAAARFSVSPTQTQEVSSVKHLIAVCAFLGLATAGLDEPQLEQAILKHLKEGNDATASLKSELDALRGELQVKDGETAVQAVAALKASAVANKPDPEAFVPIAVVHEMRDQIVALKAQSNGQAVESLVDDALSDGRLLASQKDWAIELGQKNLASLKSFIESAAPIAALKSTQTNGKKPEGKDDDAKLTPAELAICSATGVSPEEFAKQKASLAA